jgi:single-strand DNA-binding protein
MAQDLNSTIMTGRLANDIKVEEIESGDKKFVIGQFSLAVNKYNKPASFFVVKIISKKVPKLFDYLNKGNRVALKGEMVQERWKTKDGEDRNKYVFMVNSSDVVFLSSMAEKSDDSSNDNEEEIF